MTPDKLGIPKTKNLAQRFCLERSYPVTLFFRNKRLRVVIHGELDAETLEQQLKEYRMTPKEV